MARPKRTQLTPEQKLYAEFELTPQPEREQVQVFCEKVGVSREALRLWREKPEYIEYKTRLKVALIESHYTDIIASMAALEVRIGALIKLNAAVLGTEGANRISEKDFSEGELAELRGE